MQERNIEEYANSYLSMPFLKENVQYRRDCVLEQIKKYTHRNILEIGCGMFPVFQHLKGDYDNYLVIEPSSVFVENAKEKATGQQNIEIVKGYFEEESCKLNGRKFDFIMCSSLLHEVPDAKNLLDAIWQVAGENTVIHINVPNAMSMHRLIAMEMGLIEDVYQKSNNQKQLQQRDVYDMETLKQQVIESGFEVVESGSYFIKPFTHYQMSEMLNKGIINQEVLTGLQKIIKYFPEYGSEIYVNLIKRG